MKKHKVVVVSFEPDPEQGGVGGFDWHPDPKVMHQVYLQRIADEEEPICTVVQWVHETDHDPSGDHHERLAITDEIDALWSESWPPEGAEVITRTPTVSINPTK